MHNQTLKDYSTQLGELIDKLLDELRQANLGKDEVLKIVKTCNKPEDRTTIISWFSNTRDKAVETRNMLAASVFVLFIGIMGMIGSANGIPPGDIGLSAVVSSAALLTCCILSVFYFHQKAASIDRKLERVLPALDSYWSQRESILVLADNRISANSYCHDCLHRTS